MSELHSVDKEMTRLEVEDPHSNATSTCSYHSKGGFGHSTMGVRSVTLRLLTVKVQVELCKEFGLIVATLYVSM